MDILDLIEEEKKAGKSLEEVKLKANKILNDAKKEAEIMIEKASREKYFQDFIDKKTVEIEEKKIIFSNQYEDECKNLKKRAEPKINQVVDFVLGKVLGVEK